MKLNCEITRSAGLLVTACALAAIAILPAIVPAQADDAKPEVKRPAAGKGSSSLDDELLKQLDDTLGGQPAAKHGHDHDHKPAAAKSDAADAGKPAPASETSGAVKRPARPSTDEELLKQLDAQDDPAVGPKQEKSGDDLGQNADPLTRIGAKMRQAVTLIDREKLSEKTTLLQDEIVHDIDELIKQQKKKMQQQQQQSSSQSQQQKSQRSSVKPQGQKAQQQQRPRGGDGQESKDPAQESTERLGKNEQKPPQLDLAAQDELLKRVWGLLPEKDREQMRQAAGDQFLPEYESLIIQYFQRLAEEENPQP